MKLNKTIIGTLLVLLAFNFSGCGDKDEDKKGERGGKSEKDGEHRKSGEKGSGKGESKENYNSNKENENNEHGDITGISIDENGSVTANLDEIIGDIAVSDLNETEKRSILFIREEEKLARDMYLYIDSKYSNEISIFGNIANKAEQTHMDLVKGLLTRYSLKDPITKAEDKNLGVFQNKVLQSEYDKLVAKSNISLIDAIEVGLYIEDLDIRDIEKYMTKTDNKDILKIYQLLVDGSESHMKAFVKQYDKYNATYTPQFISQDRFNAIFSK